MNSRRVVKTVASGLVLTGLLAFLLAAPLVRATPPIGTGPTIEFASSDNAVSGDMGQHVYNAAAVDLDKDGDLDLVTGRGSATDEIQAWQNDGSPFSGTWSVSQIGDTGTAAYAVAVADLDHDGYVDLIGGGTDDLIYIFQGNSSPFAGTWATRAITTTSAGNVNGLAVADVNRDGNPDIVSAHTSSSGNEVSVWENPYDASTNPNIFDEYWTAHTLSQSTSKTANAVAVADIDRDGYFDLVVGYIEGSSGSEVIVWENRYDATAWSFAPRNVDSDSGTVNSVAVGDINNDGYVDIVQGSIDNEILAYETITSTWTFAEKTVASSLGDAVEAVALVDLDNDGYLDIAAGVGATATNEVMAFGNDADATFDWSFTQHNLGATSTDVMGLAVGDLDSDGDADLVTARDNDTSGTGYEVAAWRNDLPHRNAFFPTAYGMIIDGDFDGGSDVYATDMDGDSDVDVLGLAYYGNHVAWWENTVGDGRAWSKHVVDNDFVGFENGIHVADVDGDGDPDVLGATPYVDDVVWWENTAGDASAWSKHNVDSDFDGARRVYAADLDGDGDVDVLGAGSASSGIVWWENIAGDGSIWDRHNVDASAGSVFDVCAADIDGDGDLDVLSAVFTTYDITWWENTAGDGSAWSEHSVDDDFGRAYSVCAADIDRDGDLDVLSAAYDADDITWWENTAGDGSAWSEHSVDANFDEAADVRAADVDGDGDVDVLGAAISSDIAWWENTVGDGSAWSEHSVGGDVDGANRVCAADVDGDGDLDVLNTVFNVDDISWWRNTGGSAGLDVTDTAPDEIIDGTEDDVFKVVFTHNGIDGDRTLELSELNLDVLHIDCTTAYTETAARAIIDDMHVRLDDGDEVFSETVDSAVVTVDTLSLITGVQTINFTNNDASVWVTPTTTVSRTYWVSVKTTDDASDQRPNGFCIEIDPDAGILVEGKTPDFGVSQQDTGTTSTGGTSNSAPTAVTLARFEAAPKAGAVLVEWETAIEIDNVGFNLYRAESPGGPYIKLNDTLIPSQSPGSVWGAVYTWLDEDVEPDVVYYYKLEDIEVGGARTFHGLVSASVQNPTALSLTSFAARGGGGLFVLLAAALVTGSALVFRRRRK